MKHAHVLRVLVAWLVFVESFGAIEATGAAPEIEEAISEQGAVEEAGPRPGPEAAVATLASETMVSSIDSPPLRALLAEALERNPSVARARREAAALAARAPQVRAWPEPMVALTWFALPPETRVGPQRLSVSFEQTLPWRGKLGLAEQAAILEAAAAEAAVETARLDVLTEARRLYHEVAFHDAHRTIVHTERSALVRFEQAAQARYAAGSGLLQETVRIQAQITRADTRLLEMDEHAARHHTALNALRDQPAMTPIEIVPLAPPAEPLAPTFDLDALRSVASRFRPELVAADAKIAAAEARRALAAKQVRPDVTLGLAYTLVDRGGDDAARLAPPSGNGDDILSLRGAVKLPVRRKKLVAAEEEARAWRWAAEEEKRRVGSEIERALGDLAGRIPLLHEHWRLLEKVLQVQAREALRSAEIAYTTGKLNAVDLLDAEVVLLEVQVAAARTLADLAIAHARLERALAQPLAALDSTDSLAEDFNVQP